MWSQIESADIVLKSENMGAFLPVSSVCPNNVYFYYTDCIQYTPRLHITDITSMQNTYKFYAIHTEIAYNETHTSCTHTLTPIILSNFVNALSGR